MLGRFLDNRGEHSASSVSRHGVWKRIGEQLIIGGQWPMLDPEHTQEEPPAGYNLQSDQRVGLDKSKTDLEEGGGEKPPFFVSISRRSGFRRLHKLYACGVMPWTCSNIEWLQEAKEGCADAVCKICKRAMSGSADERAASSSTWGSSSSTDDEVVHPEEAADLEDTWTDLGNNSPKLRPMKLIKLSDTKI